MAAKTDLKRKKEVTVQRLINHLECSAMATAAVRLLPSFGQAKQQWPNTAQVNVRRRLGIHISLLLAVNGADEKAIKRPLQRRNCSSSSTRNAECVAKEQELYITTTSKILLYKLSGYP